MNVEDYYEKNTKRFIRHGTGKGEYAIHRPVYGPGVTSRPKAIHYAEDQMIEEFTTRGVKTVIDLGCGVGGTMKYMYRRYAADYRGITLSPLQCRIGEDLLAETDCTIRAGDMTDPETLGTLVEGSESPRAYICIEAYLHLPATSHIFTDLSAHTQRGDVVIIQDDFLAKSPERNMPREVADFKSGWKAPNLDTVQALTTHAERNNFSQHSNTDLTPYLGPKRLANILIAFIVWALKGFQPTGGWWDNFSGGDALQKCLSKGLIRYSQIVYVRE